MPPLISNPTLRLIDSLEEKRPSTRANEAMHPTVMSEVAFTSTSLTDAAYYSDQTVLVLHMDVRDGLDLLAEAGVEVNCIVTSPPFYGQRDYELDRQIGLEAHPSEFISTLADVFDAAGEVLAPNGSLWVNIGDTYWSGKGEHRSGEAKQSARRFGIRPQDKKGDGNLTDILDPFEIQDDWFYMDIPTCLLRPNPALDNPLRGQVANTINSLRLNQDDSYVQDRCNILMDYARGDVTINFLQRRYPFLAKEVTRANLDQRTLRERFKI